MTSEEFKRMIQRKHSRPGMRANQLTKAVLQVLNHSGYKAWRNNTVGVFDVNYAVDRVTKEKPATKAQLRKILNGCRRKSQTIPGQPDIIGYQKRTGKFIGVEIKAGKDKLSTHQIRFMDEANKAGAMVIECREVSDVVELIEKLG
jgi:hypothetical protein